MLCSIVDTDILDANCVLKCNREWRAFEWTTPRKALTAMCGGMDGGTPPMLAMDIEMDADGKLISAIPTKWDDWLKLPVRENDLWLTNKQGKFRCPLVLVTPVYSGMPVKGRSFSSEAIWRRDGGRCQVSGRKLLKHEGNMGHIVARAKGGKRTFKNIILMDKELNRLQGTLLPEQMGWEKQEPKEPMPVPAQYLMDEFRHVQQSPFITK